MKGKGSRRRPSLYKHVIGKTVQVPGTVFGVDVPDLYYEGVFESTRLLCCFDMHFPCGLFAGSRGAMACGWRTD